MVLVQWESVLYSLSSIMNDGVFWLFMVSVMLDFFTGTGKAIVKREMNSKIGTTGLIKHLTIIILVIVIWLIGDLGNFEMLGYMFVTFYVFEYITSILENLDGMGVKFPKWLRERLVQMKKNEEDRNSNKWGE